jgi:hypothetical protein
MRSVFLYVCNYVFSSRNQSMAANIDPSKYKAKDAQLQAKSPNPFTVHHKQYSRVPSGSIFMKTAAVPLVHSLCPSAGL